MKRIAAFVLIVLMIAIPVFALTQGPFSGTGAGAGWTTPTNTASSDDNDAECTLDGSNGACPGSNLYISSLGFTIPPGSVIDGITVSYERSCSHTGSCSTDLTFSGYVCLTKVAGTCTGTSKGTATTWGLADVTDTWGGAADKWGTSWTVSEINSTGFGVATNVNNANANPRTAYIDHISVTVAYTAGPPPMGKRVIVTKNGNLQGGSGHVESR